LLTMTPLKMTRIHWPIDPASVFMIICITGLAMFVVAGIVSILLRAKRDHVHPLIVIVKYIFGI